MGCLLRAFDYSCAEWSDCSYQLRYVPCEDIINLAVFTTASQFCEWFQDGTDVYNPDKYQAKPHSSPWFSAACTSVMASFIPQQNKCAMFGIKLGYTSDYCKSVL